MALSAFDEFLYIKLQLNQFSGLAERGCEKKNLFCVFFLNRSNAPVLCGKDKGLASKCCEFAFCCTVKIHLDLAKIYMFLEKENVVFKSLQETSYICFIAQG